VMIFGMMFGLLVALGGCLGYLATSLLFNGLRSRTASLRHEALCALSAALATYPIGLALLSTVGELLGQLNLFEVNGFWIMVVPWTLVAFPSASLIFLVAPLCRRGAECSRRQFSDRPGIRRCGYRSWWCRSRRGFPACGGGRRAAGRP
jgi:hypothetical protein